MLSRSMVSTLTTLFLFLKLFSTVQSAGLLMGQVAVSGLQYNGTACPTSGAISFELQGNTTTITYAPENLPKLSKSDVSRSRTACAISVKLNHPGLRGYLDRTEYEGGLDIGDGVALAVRNAYFTKASQTQRSSQIDLRGPKQGSFKANDDNNSDKEMWLPCNATEFEIRMQERFTISSQKDTFDSRFTAPVVQKIGIIWYPFDAHWGGCSSS